MPDRPPGQWETVDCSFCDGTGEDEIPGMACPICHGSRERMVFVPDEPEEGDDDV